MSGHSKWANIKRKKEINDKAKGIVFAKLSRLITLAVIEGGGNPNPDFNFKLRLIVDKARDSNMPKENITRAIEKGSGPNKASLKEVWYEGFAPHGIVFIIQATTDNPNRTVNEIKNHLESRGGKMGSQGSVSYLFQKCGFVVFEKSINSEDAIFQFSEQINAFDMEQDDASITVYFPFEQIGKVKDHIGTLKGTQPEIDFKPFSRMLLESDSQTREVMSLIESLEGLDDVHGVFSNMKIPASLLV